MKELFFENQILPNCSHKESVEKAEVKQEAVTLVNKVTSDSKLVDIGAGWISPALRRHIHAAHGL